MIQYAAYGSLFFILQPYGVGQIYNKYFIIEKIFRNKILLSYDLQM